ncbi:EPIDERMAL PATTERNING FACTOR-like protein 2 [Cucurbita moschata]|uniref:Epidermal patterning factor-like protein n=1 Tax=Cucurbita moschata TaxID=3662 RepID=A0A6J1GIN2_CUCMO|nr:EPIDERMAL PATTERNING FACTOR-like protein 2 [Cucurbita moschata]
MGSLQIWHRNKHLSIPFLFFLSVFLFIHLTSIAEGRGFQTPLMEDRKVEEQPSTAELVRMRRRSQIGSQPPSCRRRCRECGGPCEAIQVPVAVHDSTHQKQRRRTRRRIRSHFSSEASSSSSSSKHNKVALSSEDETSNYKPISWKCKCGNFIFNP